MIELIEWKEIFENKKIIASVVGEIQRAFYEGYNIDYYDAINYGKICVNSYINVLNSNCNDIKVFTKTVSGKLVKLFDTIISDEFYILIDRKYDFFNALSNKYRPLKTVYKRLVEITGKNNYHEAFIVNKLCLNKIIDIMFWLCRCDPEMENILFFEKNENYYFNFCKYGNIHLTEINKNNITEKIINETGFTIIEGREFDNFTGNGKINGRKIKI